MEVRGSRRKRNRLWTLVGERRKMKRLRKSVDERWKRPKKLWVREGRGRG